MEMLENSFTVVIGLIIGGLILAKYFMKKSISSIPIFAFPPDRRENFNMIRKFENVKTSVIFKHLVIEWRPELGCTRFHMV